MFGLFARSARKAKEDEETICRLNDSLELCRDLTNSRYRENVQLKYKVKGLERELGHAQAELAYWKSRVKKETREWLGL